MEETRKLRAAFFCYVGQLDAIISISIFSAWYANSLLLGCAKIVGPIPTRLLVAVLTFIIGHLFLEILARRNERMIMLWPFKQVSKFRKWLWVAVSLGLVVGVAGNLLANRIQMTMDHGKRLNAVSVPIVVKPNASIGQQT